MISTLIALQIILTLIIVVAVLLQKSSSIGLGAYSGSNESLFGAKGPMGFLAKFTFTVGILFVVNTLALGYFYAKEHNKSVADMIPSNNTIIPSAPSAPIAPQAPETK